MDDGQTTGDWSRDTFGGAVLGDVRRTERLVAMAAAVASNPAGKVTQVFASGADREGAFRLLENDDVHSARVSDAVFDASAQMCADEAFVYVAVDATSLTLTDRKKRRELGRVGPAFPTRGLHVMSALAVDPLGATVGHRAMLVGSHGKSPRKEVQKLHAALSKEGDPALGGHSQRERAADARVRSAMSRLVPVRSRRRLLARPPVGCSRETAHYGPLCLRP